MSQSFKVMLLLALAILGRYIHTTNAVPLVNNNPATTYYDGVDFDDDDDTEIIDVIPNALDVPTVDDDNFIDLSFFGSAIFGNPDTEETAALVANYTADNADVNPEELGSYLEGDILIPNRNVLTKNGVTSQSSRWANGIVPYEIRGNFNARDMATIESAIQEYHRQTCIRFVPRSSERDYVSIVSGNSGCWSSVGRIGGKQEVNLQSPGCLNKHGTAIHELMHAVGFLHEQNRQERDGFVSIQYQNVQQHAVSNFEKAASTNAFGVPYDYGSVMHYSANAFSSNGRPTIIAVQPGGSERMGQRNGFSAFDVEKLNQMYNCGLAAPNAGPGFGPGPIAGPGFGPGPAGPGQLPGVAPPLAPAPAVPNSVIGSFLGGLISGLGLAEEETTSEPTA